MATKLKKWNRTVFGNIHSRKRKLERRLEGIQKSLDGMQHRGLIKLERKIRQEFEDVLHQEEILWFQQAREEWICSGDGNTKFYHAATKTKRARRNQFYLEKEEGVPFSNIEEEEGTIRSFFETLFKKDQESDLLLLNDVSFPTIPATFWNFFNEEFSLEEIKNVVFEMSPL
ncbi:PREDICTED: uncharacterized protein LOC109174052 [Ipomoea nil]|uniref:uncharacterized protein LOC109174052 n=1 Tax=Ipomoea nil TaxID=35883 RepID=UPI000900A398|nr:PREDICTED: uncharacterized protein LOC109174052 [Ipomoea nil]